MNAPQVVVEPVVRTILEQQDLGQGKDRHQRIDDVVTERHHHWSGFVRQHLAGFAIVCHSSALPAFAVSASAWLTRRRSRPARLEV